VIGGGIIAFLHAQGVSASRWRKDLAATALRIIMGEAANCAIILPVDAIVAILRGQCAVHAYGSTRFPPTA
jgi:3-phosphoglycerate kinase